MVPAWPGAMGRSVKRTLKSMKTPACQVRIYSIPYQFVAASLAGQQYCLLILFLKVRNDIYDLLMPQYGGIEVYQLL